MKKYYLAVVITLFCTALQTNAQVTNLTVNRSSSNFTATSGDTIRWEYNIPVGATANVEIWYNVNQNGSIDSGTDIALFIFTQTDGNTLGDVPPDLDGSVNGHILFFQRVGIAPGKYVFRFTHNAVSQSVSGTVLTLPSPAHTISGTVTPPAGKSAQYIFIELRRNESFGDPNFWDGVTDVNGAYSIKMNADTAGNPWRIRPLSNPFPPTVITPEEISLTITGNHTGNNFALLQAAAQVAGSVKDEANNPVIDRGVFIFRNDGAVNRGVGPDNSGMFRIGLLPGELTNQTWTLQGECNCPDGITTTELTPQARLPVIHSGDSLYRQLIYYNANSQIRGHVRVNGGPPNFHVFIGALNSDSAQSQTLADSGTGNFTLQVTNKIRNYSVSAIYQPPNVQSSTVIAHPGDTGVLVNVTTVPSFVEEREPGIPGQFTLQQNYPNPFNPITTIDYDLPTDSRVQLIVFDVLGREVARLVNEKQDAGKYRVKLDGSRLGSGVYFYRLDALETATSPAKSHSITRKLILMK